MKHSYRIHYFFLVFSLLLFQPPEVMLAQKAINFSDDSAHILFGEVADLNVSNITIEVWIELHEDKPGVIFAKPGAYYFRVNDDLLLDAGIYDHSTDENWHIVTGTTQLNINEYYHVAFTFDGSNLIIYLDGVIENTTTYSGSIDPYLTNGVFAGNQIFIDDYEDYSHENDDTKIYEHENYSTTTTAWQRVDLANDRYWFHGDNSSNFEDEAISIIKGFTALDYIVEVDELWSQGEGIAYISKRFNTVSNKYEVALEPEYNELWLNKVVSNSWSFISNASILTINTDTWYTVKSQIISLPTTNNIKAWVNGNLYIDTNDPDLHFNKLAILVHDHEIGFSYDIYFDNLKVFIPFKGLIDELRVYDTAVSQTNISTWKNKLVDNNHPNWANLHGYWRFDDEANPTEDYSVNSNTGFIVNATFVDSEINFLQACLIQPTNLDFNTILVGDSKDTVFTITNTEEGVLSGNISETCSHFSVVAGGGDYSLSADETLFVTVRFEPTSSDTFMCTIETGSVYCGDVSCIGIGEEPPACYVQPTSIDFGTVEAGGSKDSTFTIKNIGGGFLSDNVSISCNHFSFVSGGGPYSLAAGESIIVAVRFEPSGEGTHNCTIDTGNSLCSDVFLTGVGSTGSPIISSVLDIGNDQGRWVRINFLSSPFDIESSSQPIHQYEAFRRIDSLPNKIQLAGTPLDGMVSAKAGWEFVGAVPAHTEEEYNIITPTLADSTINHGIHWSVFFIRAATSTPSIFFDSFPDSGYSLDNIAPNPPQGFSVIYNTGNGNQLLWEISQDEDFHDFRIYRSTNPVFEPTFEFLVQSTIDIQWADPDFDWWGVYYKITAVDTAGNESDTASEEVTSVTPEITIPEQFALYQNTPNPFNPITVIHYDVPSGGGKISLKVYDVGGRLVKTLVEEEEIAGRKAISWDGTNYLGQSVASGIYFYRLKAPGYDKTQKMVLLQ